MVIDRKKVKSICAQIKNCGACTGLDRSGALYMDEKQTGLYYMYPVHVPIDVMFIAESPPRPGSSFFYDEHTGMPVFRNKIFKLLNSAGLGPINSLREFTDKGFFLTDAINCRWDKSKKKNLPVRVFRNCSVFLEKQIRLFKPRFIAAMGNKAKQALTFYNVETAVRELGIPDENIIKMAFPLRAVNESDEERIKKLKHLRMLLG